MAIDLWLPRCHVIHLVGFSVSTHKGTKEKAKEGEKKEEKKEEAKEGEATPDKKEKKEEKRLPNTPRKMITSETDPAAADYRKKLSTL